MSSSSPVQASTPTPPIDKSSWGAGPWQSEPDRKEWRDPETGLPCLALRSSLGAWCGYVAIPPGHPAHGKDYSDVGVRVHGGLTYGAKCDGDICHVPAPGEPDDVWWLGFDCAHHMDVCPAMDARDRERGWSPSRFSESQCYKPLEYVEQECACLARQLADLSEEDLREREEESSP